MTVVCVLVGWSSEFLPPPGLCGDVCQAPVLCMSSADRLQLAPKMDQNSLPVSFSIISNEADG